MDKEIFKNITYGMYLVGTNNNNKFGGCIINTLSQVTSENPIISINLSKNNYTNQTIKEEKTFSISILEENINQNIISVFGFSSSKDKNKFENIDFETINNLPVLKEGTCGYLICEVINIIDCDTHDIILAKVIDAKTIENKTPMTYKYYHEVIKGKAPKNAPTYIEEQPKEDEYICTICGYIHKGELPEDFICPICGATKEYFKKK